MQEGIEPLVPPAAIRGATSVDVQGEAGSAPGKAETSQPQDTPTRDTPAPGHPKLGHPNPRVGTDPRRYPQLSPQHRSSILRSCIIILQDRGQTLHWVTSSL